MPPSEIASDRSSLIFDTNVSAKKSGPPFDRRVGSFVVVEVVAGHQLLRHWNSQALVEYVHNLILGGAAPLPQTPEQQQKTLAVTPSSTYSKENSLAEVLSSGPHRESTPQPPGPQQASQPIQHHYHYYIGQSGSVDATAAKHNDHSRSLYTSKLSYRDVRQVFTQGSPVPSIEVRHGCIMVCLPPLSCLLLHDRVLFLVVEDMDLDPLLLKIRDLQLGLEKKSSLPSTGETNSDAPFELAAFELVVTWALNRLQSDIQDMEEEYRKLANNKNKRLNASQAIKCLNEVKATLHIYENRAKLFDQAIAERLNCSLQSFALTRLYKRENCCLQPAQAENAEWMALLEFLDQELEVSQQHIERLEQNMKGMERWIQIRLLELRTSMSRLELGGSLVGAAFAVGTLISGIFGMNMRNTWEDSNAAFVGTVGVISLLTLIGLVWSYAIIRSTYYI